jgi:cytochrome b561
MGARNTRTQFGWVARWLHWGVFALIALQIAGGNAMEALPRQGALRSMAFDAHQTIGLVVLFLVFLRLAWRMANPAPPHTGAHWQRVAAGAVHAGLYILMVAIPLVGYAMVDAKGYDVAFFGWTAPDLVATNDRLADRLEDLHETLAGALVTLVIVHVGAALWHQFVLRDGVLFRMLARRPSTLA